MDLQNLSNHLFHHDSQSQNNPLSWIPANFQKRECCKFVPIEKDRNKCGCGKAKFLHPPETLPPDDITDNSDYAQCSTQENSPIPRESRWSIQRNTQCFPTDAYGTIEFQGGPHPHKAQFVRLGFDSDPELIMHLFTQVWGIAPPKLVITVHGGMANFSLQPKLARAFRKGLLKAAKTTGAWIITSGINAGVVRHVASAVSEGGHAKSSSKKKIVTIGITPWGLLKKREDLVSKNGKEVSVPYHPQAFSPKGRLAVLNDKHSYFLLVDNGIVSRYGADIILRKRLEEYISQQTIEGSSTRKGSKAKTIPVVCVVLEGGSCTIKSVLDYVTNIPPVPVVVCDGSGRAADLLAFAHQHSQSQDGGKMEHGMKMRLTSLVESLFAYTREQAEKIVIELQLCVRKKELITIFRLGDEQDVDHAILTALLKGQQLSAPDQLSLALTWNRADIARSDIFVLGQEWPTGSLDAIMMEALLHDRVDFVKLLLANGVSMERFLTMQRLEELYNQQQEGNRNTLRYILQDVKPDYKPGRDWISLPLIGLCMRQLMGGTYNSTYLRKDFKIKYDAVRQRIKEEMKMKANELKNSDAMRDSKMSLSRRHLRLPGWRTLVDVTPSIARRAHKIEGQIKNEYEKIYNKKKDLLSHPSLRSHSRGRVDTAEKDKNDEEHRTEENPDPPFFYPFNELLVWSVLTNRQKMAKCMWLHGEEALAKALVACKLYKSLANEAADDYLEQEICSELKQNSEEFRRYSHDLLEACYQADDDLTMQLLTYELTNWGKQTCLTLAVLAHHKEFLAHPGCQILLADLWNGGLRIRRYVNWKVLLGLFCPMYVLFLEFKSKEQLLQQPQTAAEHADQGIDSGINSSLEQTPIDSEAETSDQESLDIEHGLPVSEPVSEAAVQLNNNRKFSGGSVKSNSSSKSGGIFNWINQKTRDSGRKKRRATSIYTKRSLSTVSGDQQTIDDRHRSLTGRIGRFVSVNNPRLKEFNPSNHTNVQSPNRVNFQRQTSRDRRASGDVMMRPKEFTRLNTLPEINAQGRFSMRNPSTHVSPDRIDLNRKKSGAARGLEIKYSTDQNRGLKGFHGSLPVMPTDSMGILNPRTYRTANKELGMRKRFYEFYVAPVTTFWSFTISYMIFLTCFSYICLVKTPATPSGIECFIIVYIFSLWCDNIRKILMAEPVEFRNKVKVFCDRIWNWMTLLSCVFFFVGVALRISNEAEVRAVGRLIYCINVMFWYLRLLDIFSVNSTLGPYITMVGKMVVNMVYICIILTVILAAFGLCRQAIHFPDENFHWKLVRNIFYKPYFMLYGEVYAFEIDTCGDEGKDCVVGGWLTPLFMAIFLLLANILLINLLIAVFNNIFQETNAISHQLWKFQRYTQVMEYESSPFLPPPFTLLAHVYLIYKYICKDRFSKKRLTFDYALKLFLKAEDVEKIHDFEEEVMDEMMKRKEIDSLQTTPELIRRIAEHNEMLIMRMNEMRQEMASKSHVAQQNLPAATIKECGCHAKQTEQDEKLDAVLLILNQLMKNTPKSLESPYMGPDLSTTNAPSLDSPLTDIFGDNSRPISSTGLAYRRAAMPAPLLGLGKIDEETTDRLGAGGSSEVPHPLGEEDIPMHTTDASTTSTAVLPRPTHEPEFGIGVQRLKIPSFNFHIESPDTSDSDTSNRSPLSLSARSKKRIPIACRRVRSLPISSNETLDSISPSLPRHAASFSKANPSAPPHRTSPTPKSISTNPQQAEGSADQKLALSNLPHPTLSFASDSSEGYRRPGEYTSITDSISVHALPQSATSLRPVSTIGSYSTKCSLSSEDPTGSLEVDQAISRAHPSFILKHNQMMRELEETGSRIAGCLREGRYGGRDARESSMCVARSEDLKDMGLSDPDIQDYLALLNRDKSNSRSSSLDSLSSSRMEDAEGFYQISECLIDQEEKKKTGSAPQSPPENRSNPGVSSGYCADSESIYSPSSSTIQGTPVTSPVAKASQVFSFDKATLQEFLNHYEEEDERQLLCDEEEEE